MVNFLMMTVLAVTVLDVPLRGSFAALALAALIYSMAATSLGLLASTFMRSQIAALFATMLGTMLPAIQFAGMINPVSSLTGAGRLIGEVFPMTYMLTISRGVFSKALVFGDLHDAFLALLITVPVLLGTTILLLKKQDA
jgi:ribosome-dependent ATPase